MNLALTPREREVAVHLGQGLSPSEIAVRLGVVRGYVSNTITRASEKLRVATGATIYNRHQLAEYARNQGWCA